MIVRSVPMLLTRCVVMLAAAGAAGPSWANGLPAVTCGPSPIDPICELAEPGAKVPWGRYEARPLLLLPAWRYDVLTDAVLERDELATRRVEDQRRAELHLASVVAAGYAREIRLRADLDACAAGRSGTWHRWEVALLAVGVGVGAAAVGAIVGYVVSVSR